MATGGRDASRRCQKSDVVGSPQFGLKVTLKWTRRAPANWPSIGPQERLVVVVVVGMWQDWLKMALWQDWPLHEENMAAKETKQRITNRAQSAVGLGAFEHVCTTCMHAYTQWDDFASHADKQPGNSGRQPVSPASKPTS